jgi:hypothetical protein
MKRRFPIGLLIFFAVPLVLFAALIEGRSPGQEQTVRRVRAIPQPDGWVPFSADVAITEPDGSVSTGRFFRASDGSTREEGRGADYAGIAIHNIPRAIYYEFTQGATDKRNGGRGSWTARPMQLPARGWKPERFHEDTPGLTPISETVEGLTVYREERPDGTVLLRAPALNFFALVSEGGPLRRKRVYSNIEFGEPPRDLFEPPPGAHIIQLTEPGGIIAKPTRPR